MTEIDLLRKSTDELLSHFTKRVDKMKNKDQYSLLIRRLDPEQAKKYAVEYFGEGEYQAVGIDGSLDQAETLEMLLFYVNAVAYSCPFIVNKDGVSFDFKKIKKEDKIGASSAVPLWVEDLSFVSEERRPEQILDINASLDDVSFSLMLLAELTSAERSMNIEDARLIFLDRPLSGTFQSLSRDVRYLLKKGNSALRHIHNGELMRDVFLFNAVPVPEMSIPLHGPNLVYRIIQIMLNEGLSIKEACDLAGLDKKQKDKVIDYIIEKDRQYGFLQGDDRLAEESKKYLKRLEDTAYAISERLFQGKEHPLKMSEEEWLTTIDLNLVNQIKLASLIRKSLLSKKILIGITKDTSSTDVSRSVIALTKLDESLRPGLKHDRVMFTILSATNEELFMPPWRSIGYDAVFATLSENEDEPKLKAARKVASREKMFVKCFFQSRASDKTIYRSPVFLYDRPFMSDYDESFCKDRSYLERNKVEIIKPYLEESGMNQFDNMILYLLALSDYPEVFEAYGHNVLLYMADKAAKADAKLKKGMLLGTISLKLTPMARKEKLFTVIRRYRDARSDMEASRESQDKSQ